METYVKGKFSEVEVLDPGVYICKSCKYCQAALDWIEATDISTSKE